MRKAKTKVKPVKAEAETRERLLDVAELLFGRHGFDGASVRAITAKAKVNLGAITYHFGSKERLYLEAFFRRVRPVNQGRLAELEALRAAAGPQEFLPVAEVLRCLLRGPLRVAEAHPTFVALLARNLTMPPDFALQAIRREMDPLEGPFFSELMRALPQVPPPILRFRLMLSGGGLFFLLCHWPRIAGGQVPAVPPLPPEMALELLVQFAAAGLSAPVPFKLP